MRENILTQERLKQMLFYNPETGLFNWLRAGLTRAPKKIIAGCSDANGYCVIRINGKQYKAHRLVWLYVYGELPEREIDHINGNPSCNILSNLRLTTRLENGKNRAINTNNTSGYKGVSWHKRMEKWHVSIRANGKNIYLGVFADLEVAKNARIHAEIKMFGQYRRCDIAKS
jgi:HNH endonuclease/AP2 domain